jgi:hypothetical protein
MTVISAQLQDLSEVLVQLRNDPRGPRCRTRFRSIVRPGGLPLLSAAVSPPLGIRGYAGAVGVGIITVPGSRDAGADVILAVGPSNPSSGTRN